jgi:hypothetical protein
LNSFVIMPGTICSPVRFEGEQARFSLKNDNGTFFINAQGMMQVKVCQALEVDDDICIVARVCGFRNRQCGKHHVYLEAMAVMTLAEGQDFAPTWQGLDIASVLSRLLTEGDSSS